MATTISVKVNKDQTYGQALTKAGVNNPTRANYNFAGWNTKADGTGETRTSSQAVVKSETIYAQWSAVTYTVTFDLDGGTRTGGGALIQTINYGGSATVPTCTRTGYVFNGWSGTYTNVTSDRTIIAQWTQVYTITFNSSGGSSVPSLTATEGEEIYAPTPPTKSGYTFDGWWSAASGGSQQTFPFTVTGNKTLYAHWIDNKTNNFISVNYGAARPRAEATHAVTSQLTVGLMSDQAEQKTSVIEIGDTIGSVVSAPALGSEWYIEGVSPSSDDNYYYIY